MVLRSFSNSLDSSLLSSAIATALFCSAAAFLFYHLFQIRRRQSSPRATEVETPVSVDYHFSRKCNYECGFCFHTGKTSTIVPLNEAKRGLKLLKEAGMKKLNLAGGEPFLYPKFLKEVLRYGKEELGIESISIVSNGSKITERLLSENAAFIDILAISCDSFRPEVNIKIGRGITGENVAQLTKVASWCRKLGIKFKINTVVCSLNWDEDMTTPISTLQPFRWEVFQCLIVTGENDNEQRKRDARSFLVTDEQWITFCDRHKHLACFVPESNDMMRGSYLILDEYMRFLDKSDGEETASESILDVGVGKAMTDVRWEQDAFVQRGGLYDWTKAACSGGLSGIEVKELDW